MNATLSISEDALNDTIANVLGEFGNLGITTERTAFRLRLVKALSNQSTTVDTTHVCPPSGLSPCCAKSRYVPLNQVSASS